MLSMQREVRGLQLQCRIFRSKTAIAAHASDPAPLTGSFPKADGSGSWPETRFTFQVERDVFVSMLTGPAAPS